MLIFLFWENNQTDGLSVKALRNEMTTHVAILVSAYLFNLEIVVINWQEVSANNISKSLVIHEVKSQSLVNHGHLDTYYTYVS